MRADHPVNANALTRRGVGFEVKRPAVFLADPP